MKKSILILAVSAFYLIACGDSKDDHSHSDDEGHSHEENSDHHKDHEGHDHGHDKNNEQENFVIDKIDSVIEDTASNAISKPVVIPDSKTIEEHVHDGHDHDHEGHKH